MSEERKPENVEAQQPNSPTAQQPNSPTAQQPNSPTAQQPNSPTAQQPNSPTTHSLKSKKSRKYLVFRLSDNSYGVPLSEVREVIGLPQCVPIPNSPAYFLGIINLRGKVVSALDLKKKLGIASPVGVVIKRPAVVITENEGVTLGCVVDSISEVLSIDDSSIDRSLELEMQGKKEFIEGIARFSDREMILLLDLKIAADVSAMIRQKELQRAS
jgi:purine-binding chemotaxis protein CheW